MCQPLAIIFLWEFLFDYFCQRLSTPSNRHNHMGLWLLHDFNTDYPEICVSDISKSGFSKRNGDRL